MALKLKIVTPEKIEYDGEALSVFVPGTLGQFEILDNHAPIISTLVEGDIKYTSLTGDESVIHVDAGFVSVHRNEVNVCVEV